MALILRAALLAAGLAAAALPAGAQSFDGLTAAQFRQVIASEPRLTIVKEDAVQGTPVFIIDFSGVKTVVALNLDDAGRGLSFVQVGYYPESLSGRMSAAAVGALNSSSQFGWFTKDADGGVAYVNADTLYGETAKGITFDLVLFTALYAAQGSSASTVSFEGGEASPREKIVDVNHRPAARLGVDAETFKALKTVAGGDALENVFSDAQSYGELRKIANDAIGGR